MKRVNETDSFFPVAAAISLLNLRARCRGLSSPRSLSEQTRPQQLPPSSPHVIVLGDPILPDERKPYIALFPRLFPLRCFVLVLLSTPDVSTHVAISPPFLRHS